MTAVYHSWYAVLAKGKGLDKMNKRQRNKWGHIILNGDPEYYENFAHHFRDIKRYRLDYTKVNSDETILFRLGDYKRSIRKEFVKAILRFANASKPYRIRASLSAYDELDRKEEY